MVKVDKWILCCFLDYALYPNGTFCLDDLSPGSASKRLEIDFLIWLFKIPAHTVTRLELDAPELKGK